ncbi:hypothetical protein BTJ40_21065 [Microbulbifer sp. A4B17]|uniref:heparan-alpha-glucosaminide N-acetyltransferase domain-containing protein n=1 Tax=Microbulbifer sp. A4B17 TaxID=359370 RepID=UPI000D52C821|nr:heparan-alpha-glucosaminide N-acetyltransferase domain-containing protein [Microbulbifer sp. A4B17]AWF83103.1 hypothetical protein BTJ40_21065 [Microbulbifer sp. A4B17]
MSNSNLSGAVVLPQKNPRILAFDLTRGIAVLFMIAIHVLYHYGRTDVADSAIGVAIQVSAGTPAASVFMLIMGIFIGYSSKPSLKQDLFRAAGLFAIGYLLNFARGTVPMWLSLQFGLVTQEQLGEYTPLSEFLMVDIFQFAGLALAICALVRHFLPHPIYWLAAAAIVAFGSSLVWDIGSNSVVIDEILQLFFGNKREGVMFPLFSWLAYPLAGMAVGYWFKNTKNIDALFSRSIWIGLALMSIGGLLIMLNTQYFFAENMRGGPGLIILLIGYTFLWLWISNFLLNKVKNRKLIDVMVFWGKNITPFYIAQWLIIGWGLMLVGSQQLGMASTLTAMFIVLLLSHFGTRAWVNFRSHKGKAMEQPAASAV